MMIFMLLTVFFGWAMSYSVGLKNTLVYLRVKLGRKNGWGLIRMRHMTGVITLYPHKFESDKIDLNGKGKEIYLFKPYCMYENEYRLPTIDYLKGNSEPLHPKTGLQTVMSAKVLENTVSRIIKADANLEGPLEEIIRKYGKVIGIVLVIAFGALLFMLMNQSETIVKLGSSQSQIVIGNLSGLGK